MIMHSNAESGFLIPDMLSENSRYSTPRSSVGDGISTDCEADVESNMSGNSIDASPRRRKSSFGIYGIVPASRSDMLLGKAEEDQRERERIDKIVSALKSVVTNYKAIATSLVILVLIVIFGCLLLLPTCLRNCRENGQTRMAQAALESKWPIQFPEAVPLADMFLFDVNGDGDNDVILAIRNASSAQLAVNFSTIIAIDGKTGNVLRRITLDLMAFKIYVSSDDRNNASCFVIARSGIVTKIFLGAGALLWQNHPCSTVHSFLVIEDIDEDKTSDLLIICSWASVIDTTLSGIALVSGANGNLVGSKIRYQTGQKPSSFLMQHRNAKNETCVLFGVQRRGKSTVLAVRLKRLLEIATGTRSKVNLVSENPLVVAKNVMDGQEPVYEDVSGDGVKDIGFILQHGIISFIDGATLRLRKTIEARSSNIISISVLNGVNFGRPLLAVVKTNQEGCQKASLNIYDLRSTFPPYTIVLPRVPTLVDEVDSASKNRFIFWFPDEQQECAAAPEIKVNNSSVENGPERISTLSEINNLPVETQRDDATDDFEIETIDKDVLNSLREYVGIDYKGASRHHKLFHLVCNYLLLRFLISYGITTESVLQDFKSTRNRLLNMSSKDLGKALTDQLKGLLANDYNDDLDSPTWFDDIENDIDWLKDVGGERRHKVKRDIYSLSELRGNQRNYGKRVKVANLEGDKKTESDDFRLPQSLHIVSARKGGSASNKLLVHGFEALDEKATHEADIKDYSKRRNGERKNEKHKDNFNSTHCTLPRPTFDSLTVGKTDFKWGKVKRLPENEKSWKMPIKRRKEKVAKSECTGISMKVIRMHIYKDYLYAMILYKNESRDTSVMMEVDKIKLTHGPELKRRL